MADREGNVLVPPSSTVKAQVTPDELLASYARFTQKGVTLAAGQGVLATGTLLVKNTTTGKYVAYVSGATGVTGIKGVLRRAVDTGSGDRLGNIVISGILKRSLMVAANATGATATAAAATALTGREDIENDYFII